MEEVEHIIKNTVTAIGEQVFDLKVIIGVYSDPNKIDYTWSVVRYIGRSLQLQIDFNHPIYISMEEEAEYVEVMIRDGSIFLSENGLPLELSA